MSSSKLGINPGADLLHRLLHHPPPLLLLLLYLRRKRLLEEEADCAAVDATVITFETMACQRRHWGSHITDRDCPSPAAPTSSLLLLFLGERPLEVVGEGSVVHCFSCRASQQRHGHQRQPRNRLRVQRDSWPLSQEWRLGSPWRAVLLALHSLSRLLHPLRAVVEGRCQLHGHRHPLMTVPRSELATPAPPCRAVSSRHGQPLRDKNLRSPLLCVRLVSVLCVVVVGGGGWRGGEGAVKSSSVQDSGWLDSTF